LISRSCTKYRDYVEVYGDDELLYSGIPFASGQTPNGNYIRYYRPCYAATIYYNLNGTNYRIQGEITRVFVRYGDNQIDGYFVNYDGQLTNSLITGAFSIKKWSEELEDWYYDFVDYRQARIRGTITEYAYRVDGSIYRQSGKYWVFIENDDDMIIFSEYISSATIVALGNYVCWDSLLYSRMWFTTSFISEGDQYNLIINLPPDDFSTISSYKHINVKRNNPLPETLEALSTESIPSYFQRTCYIRKAKSTEFNDQYTMLIDGVVYKKSPVTVAGSKVFSKYNDIYTKSGDNYVLTSQDHSTYELSSYATEGNNLEYKLLSKICPPNSYRRVEKI
jgi:hypothetical protein